MLPIFLLVVRLPLDLIQILGRPLDLVRRGFCVGDVQDETRHNLLGCAVPEILEAAVAIRIRDELDEVLGVSHLVRNPRDLWLLPVVALVVILIALPIKLYAFVTMNKQGWLTRHADSVGGDGQTARTLVPEQVAA